MALKERLDLNQLNLNLKKTQSHNTSGTKPNMRMDSGYTNEIEEQIPIESIDLDASPLRLESKEINIPANVIAYTKRHTTVND